MKIGLVYDTSEMYELADDDQYFCDFINDEAMQLISESFRALGHTVVNIGNLESLIKLGDVRGKVDLVFNTCEGIYTRNRELLAPAYFEAAGIPYIGSDAFTAAVTLNKVQAKLIAKRLGIRTPKFAEIYFVGNKLCGLERLAKLRPPIIVKPNSEGNSAGIKILDSVRAAKDYCRELSKKYLTNILAEEFIRGRELTVPIIKSREKAQVLGVMGFEEQTDGDFWLDAHYKVFGGFTDIPIQLEKKLDRKIKEWSLKLYTYLDCYDYARLDYRLGEDNKLYFLELNAFPALEKTGSFVTLANERGLTFLDIVKAILDSATERMEKK